MNEWKTYLLSILFVLTCATTGLVYDGVNNRVTTLEKDKADLINVALEVKINIAVLQQNVIDIQKSIDKLGHNQSAVLNKMDILLADVAKDSKRWNTEMDLRAAK